MGGLQLEPELVQVLLSCAPKLISRVELDAPAIIGSKPRYGPAGSPQTAEPRRYGSCFAVVRPQADVQGEPTTAIGSGRVEQLPNGHARADGKAEQLIDGDMRPFTSMALTADRPIVWPRIVMRAASSAWVMRLKAR